MCSVLPINEATGPEGVVGAVEEMSLPVADNEAHPPPTHYGTGAFELVLLRL